MTRTFTDEELQQIITYIAIRYLEVERGLRQRKALQSLMTPGAFRQLDNAPPIGRPAQGPVRQTDLGRLQFQRPSPDRVFVALPARERGNEWSALIMQLRARDGVWRVTELARVNEHTIGSRSTAVVTTPEPRDVTLARANRDLQAARLALLAVTEQHDRVACQLLDAAPRKPADQLKTGDLISISVDPTVRWSLVERLRRTRDGQIKAGTTAGDLLTLTPDSSVAVAPLATESQPEAFAALAKRLGDLADQRRFWQRQVTMLEAEHDTLTRAHPALMPEASPASRTPNYLVRILDDPPEDPDARDAWDQAAGLVQSYRPAGGGTSQTTTRRSALPPPTPTRRRTVTPPRPRSAG